MKGIQVCTNEGPHLFPRGDNYEIVKIHWKYFKIFFSIATEPISTKFGTKHPWVHVMGIQIHKNKGPCPFPRGHNNKTAKIHWQILKIFFSRTTGPISFKPGSKHPWVKEIKVYSNKGPGPFASADNFIRNSKNALKKLKKLFFQNHRTISTKLSKKASLCEGDSWLFK